MGENIKQLLESYYKNKQEEMRYTRLAVEEGSRQEVTASVWDSGEFPYIKRSITIIVNRTDKRKMRKYNEKLFQIMPRTIPVENYIKHIFDSELQEILIIAFMEGTQKNRWIRVRDRMIELGYKPLSPEGYRKRVQRILRKERQ